MANDLGFQAVNRNTLMGQKSAKTDVIVTSLNAMNV